MEDLGPFEDTFSSDAHAYSSKLSEQILRNRKALGDTLFFDRLLKSVGVDHPSKFYPPRTATDLRKLHARINESRSPLHHKQSLIYYLLADLDPRTNEARKAPSTATAYARRVHLPSKYETLIDGLWLLDRQEFEHALDKLTSPSLIPTFTAETLTVLCELAPDKPSLALSYFHTVAPEIQDQNVLDAVFRCMCRSSITEAFFYARQQGAARHRHLVNVMISTVLDFEKGEVRAQMAEELVQLPFKKDEEEWFEEFLTTGAGRGSSEAQDLVIARLISVGRIDDAEQLAASTREKQVQGLSWQSLLSTTAQ